MRVFSANARFVADDVQRFLNAPGVATNRQAVMHWLELLKGGSRYYAVGLYDADLKHCVGIPEQAREPMEDLEALLNKSLQTHAPVLSDLNRDHNTEHIHLDLVFPVFPSANQEGGKPIAVVLLKLDARHFLFPLVQSWPTPSQTAETLLVRQEGQDVLFLNDLRHQPNSALVLRRPLASYDLPSAKVLRGEIKAFEGVDYRGVPVVAAGHFIPGTQWAIVAKIDQKEVYAGLRRDVAAAVAVVIALLLAGTLLVALLWRQRASEFLERELAMQRERTELTERLAHLMHNANDIILIFDMEGRVLEANERALQYYGYTPEEMKHTRLHDLRAPQSLAGLEQQLDKIRTEGAILFEAEHRRKDGRTFPVEVSSRRIQIGSQDYLMSIVRDITQRKAHELEIERLTRLNIALSQVNQAVVRAKSRSDLMQEVCQALTEFGGFQMAWVGWVKPGTVEVTPLVSRGDTLGYLQKIHVYADDRPEGCGPVGRAICEGRLQVFNDCMSDPKFSPWREAAERSGWRSLAALPIREEGVVRGALAIYSHQVNCFGEKEQLLLEEAAADVSFGLDMLLNESRRAAAERALRSAKEELARANVNLERIVEERTAQLRTTIGELESFSYSLSHDMRAPLRTIRGFTSIVLRQYRGQLDPMAVDLLEKAGSAAVRMDQLVTDVLALTRLSREQLDVQPIDLGKLLVQILHERPELQAPAAEVRLELPLAMVLGHEASLTQCLTNLLGNAVKFVEKGKLPRVSIWTERSGAKVKLWVEDNGIGIEPEAQGRIFGIFQRLHRQDEYEGTGIGLAIVKKAVERMNGSVGVESTPGQGSRFWIELPAAGNGEPEQNIAGAVAFAAQTTR